MPARAIIAAIVHLNSVSASALSAHDKGLAYRTLQGVRASLPRLTSSGCRDSHMPMCVPRVAAHVSDGSAETQVSWSTSKPQNARSR